MPQISVIVPVYKVEPYLRRCVDSILNQTFRDFELILVDDGSPDNCGAICDEYAQKDARIRVLHQENGGLSAARNAGIDWMFANSDSEWLTFIDSDDWIHPQMLEALLDAVHRTDLPVSVASYKRVHEDAVADPSPWDPDKVEIWKTETLFSTKNVEATVAWGKMYHRKLFEDVRYPVGKIHEDEFLTYRVIFQTNHVAYLPIPMYWYFCNPDGIMSAKTLHSLYHSCEAYKQQVVFYHQNRYHRLRNDALRRMLTYQRIMIRRAVESRDMDTAKQLQAELEDMLCWAQEDLGISLYGNEYVYKPAIPIRATMSRTWRHFKMWLLKIIRR